ncbi:MAG: CRISPR-associated endonuclease Cas1 [Candidatus Bathyarchaeia archaeon]
MSIITTQRGRPVAMLKSLDDDSHVKTRLCQYEAVNNGKGVYIAKQIVLSKIKGQNGILAKYNMQPLGDKAQVMVENIGTASLEMAKRRLTSIEGKFSELYFKQIFGLFSEKLRPDARKKFKAYDGINNAFNLAYEVLSWKVHRALIRAKLEPYLGFLHSVQFGKPSLVCDFQELYRCLIDDFLIRYCRNLKLKDFMVKTEDLTRNKRGKRVYLNDSQTHDLMEKLNGFFESKIELSRIKFGESQTVETLINEEALLLAKYLRGERETWMPRLPSCLEC